MTGPAPQVDHERDRRVLALSTRTSRRAEAAANFVAGFIVLLLLVAAAVWALLTYFEPCAEVGAVVQLCSCLPLARMSADAPRPYSYTARGCVRTAAGVVIGCAWQRPPAPMHGDEAERIQATLLARRAGRRAHPMTRAQVTEPHPTRSPAPRIPRSRRMQPRGPLVVHTHTPRWRPWPTVLIGLAGGAGYLAGRLVGWLLGV